jgi:hypothetical protein
MKMELRGSATERNLKDVLAGESPVIRRFGYLAGKAELVRLTAEGESGHAAAYLEYPQAVGDPVSDCVARNRGTYLTKRR